MGRASRAKTSRSLSSSDEEALRWAAEMICTPSVLETFHSLALFGTTAF